MHNFKQLISLSLVVLMTACGDRGTENGAPDGGDNSASGGDLDAETDADNETDADEDSDTGPKEDSDTASGSPLGTEPEMMVSSPDNYWVADTPRIVDAPDFGGSNLTVSDQSFQEIDGFGGAFNEHGWDALSVLDASERDRAIELLFDQGVNGARFQYGRIPIGSSDYAMSRYTHADGPNDFAMDSFSIDRDREMLIPYIRAALSVYPQLRLWASPWTPPPWMKTNNDYDSGNMRNEPQIFDAHALYLARFVEAYGAEGLTIEAVHVQNEPRQLTNYPSCGWEPSWIRDFIRDHLGPTFHSRGVAAEIWLGTMSTEDMAFPDTVLGDTTARGYVSGVGVQWNGLGIVPGVVSAYPDIPVMQTETNCGNNHWEAGFNPNYPPNDHDYGEFTWGRILSFFQAGVRSYLSWNMVLDTEGKSIDSVRPWPQNALLVVDRQSRRLTATPAYYAFRHFSAYVDPGARRIGLSGNFSDALAFRNPDGHIIVVLQNSGFQQTAITLDAGESVLEIDLPARGWVTVKV